MELKELQTHIRTLATLDETEAPVISCYLNLESDQAGFRAAFDERVRILKKSLSASEWQSFNEALNRLEDYLGSASFTEAQGAAIFSRGGTRKFFLPLRFRVPLPNWLSVDSTPNIFHLVELKDTYARFVVLLSTEESARILEVNLGEVTETLWKERPELRKRVGREWTKEHYQNHLRDRRYQFIKEKIEMLDRLMIAGKHTHLILAGNPRMTSQIKNALPKHLAMKLVDTIPASGNDRISDVVAATLATFVEQEERESLAVVEHLRREIQTTRLAVQGTLDTLRALERGQVDVLVLAKDYEPESIYQSEFNAQQFFSANLKEAMVRFAEQQGCHIEVVTHSDVLMQLGGVGALLRYALPEQAQFQVQTSKVA
ncbi:MAG: hypothetical protein AB1757_26750 [Acidobacteriota bacterium]